ncbi:MAG TPA: hypothetical protein VG013_35395 [Gemmataceae bacterium]|jgi:hypothetical protein|nr:hypothetical protein [Gemmataceae bacterium]
MAKTDAQRVVLELIRNADGSWDGKTKLSTAFYLAHLYYAAKEPGILTDWPIVRTPQGPGIHQLSTLLQGLVKNGYLTTERTQEGPYPDYRYRLTEKAAAELPLPEDVRAAIQDAVTFVASKTAAELSQLTRERSRSWIDAKDGDLLDIYIDLIPDDEYEQEQEKLADLDRQLTTALLDQQIAGGLGVKQP